jgi:hypothetical protein
MTEEASPESPGSDSSSSSDGGGGGVGAAATTTTIRLVGAGAALRLSGMVGVHRYGTALLRGSLEQA